MILCHIKSKTVFDTEIRFQRKNANGFGKRIFVDLNRLVKTKSLRSCTILNRLLPISIASMNFGKKNNIKVTTIHAESIDRSKRGTQFPVEEFINH